MSLLRENTEINNEGMNIEDVSLDDIGAALAFLRQGPFIDAFDANEAKVVTRKQEQFIWHLLTI